jgi:hypothetical protein
LRPGEFKFGGILFAPTHWPQKFPRTNRERQKNVGTGRVRGLLAVLATSATLAIPSGASASPLEPPERFDHPYPGDVQINLMDSRFVGKECREWGAGKSPSDAVGCAWVADDGTCVVVIAKRTKKAPIEAIIRHEIAHCNGWPADHPE